MTVRRIYFDMDGVLADFDRGVREYCHMEAAPLNGKRSLREDDLMWAEIRKTDHFYLNLQPMPGAVDLFNLVYRQYGPRCEILTGIPKPERGIPDAGPDKMEWVRKYLSPDVKVNIVLRKEKIRYCTGRDCILIDDLEETIRDWNEAGGTGIIHRSPEETIQTLKEKGIACGSA